MSDRSEYYLLLFSVLLSNLYYLIMHYVYIICVQYVNRSIPLSFYYTVVKTSFEKSDGDSMRARETRTATTNNAAAAAEQMGE